MTLDALFFFNVISDGFPLAGAAGGTFPLTTAARGFAWRGFGTVRERPMMNRLWVGDYFGMEEGIVAMDRP